MRRLIWLFGIFGLGACLHGVPDDLEVKREKPVVEPIVAAEQPVTTRALGPLDLPRPDEQTIDIARHSEDRDQKRWLHQPHLAAELEQVKAVVAAFYPDAKLPYWPARESAAKADEKWLISGLATTLRQQLDSLGICIRLALDDHSCNTDLERSVSPNPADPPFVLSDVGAGIVKLAVRDFDPDTRWSSFGAAELARLRDAKGIVLDLHTAHGSDPRPLIPWLEQVTGRAPLKPLRAIERPAAADAYVAAYAERFLTRTRDRAVWDALVGEMPEAKPHAMPAIEIMLGQPCESACELVSRVLITYAGARALNNAGISHRISHDEPARLVLSTSRIAVYFYATRYLLDKYIEKKTGPSAEWTDRTRNTDKHVDVGLAFAVRDLEQLQHGGWPRCDALPYVQQPSQLPAALKPKLPNAALWNDPCPKRIRLFAPDVPYYAIRDLLRTCGYSSLGWGGDELYDTDGIKFGVVAQIAASPLVQRIELECTRYPPRSVGW